MGCGCGHFIRGLALFLQVGIAAAVVAITLTQLAHYTVEADMSGATVSEQCLLGYSPKLASGNMNLCTMTYIVAGVSIGATMLLGLLMCLTCNLCGLGPVLDLLFAAAGATWWGITGWIMYEAQLVEPQLTAPKEDWRMIVTYLFWAAGGLFFISFLAALFTILSTLCKCCCSGGSSSPDIERPYSAKQSQFMYR